MEICEDCGKVGGIHSLSCPRHRKCWCGARIGWVGSEDNLICLNNENHDIDSRENSKPRTEYVVPVVDLRF